MPDVGDHPAMRTRSLLLSILVLALLTTGCPARPATTPRARPAGPPLPEVAEGGVKVYTGTDGLRMDVLRLKDGSYLLRPTGSTSPLDSLVLPCRHEAETIYRQVWLTRYNGNEIAILERMQQHAGEPRYRIFLPGTKVLLQVAVAYDAERSRTLDVRALLLQGRAQAARLAKVQRFDWERRTREEDESLAHRLASVNRACGARFTARIDWDTLTERTPEAFRAYDLFDAPVDALGKLCGSPGVAAVLREQLAEFRIRLGSQVRVERQGRTLVWTAPHAVRNRAELAVRLMAETLRWARGETLAQVVYDEEATACRDDRGRIVARRLVRPRDRWGDFSAELLYGTDKGLTRVPREPYQRDGEFYEPRYPWAWHRGSAPRLHSAVRIPSARNPGACSVRCGSKEHPLQHLPAAEVQRLLAREPAPPLPRREPYGLARDRSGTYYYVDRAADRAQRDFRLYRGPLGKLTPLPMTNIVSDSMGDVFTTKSGSLRLVLEKESSFWVERGKSTTLINVPVSKNLSLIFNELGLYLAQPFGTPCDLF
jgi:hypothetical protein